MKTGQYKQIKQRARALLTRFHAQTLLRKVRSGIENHARGLRKRLFRTSADRLTRALAKPGAILILGEGAAAERAFSLALRAASTPLLLLDPDDAWGDGVARTNAIRLAPGDPRASTYNPLFALRSGDDAWRDARRLAAALLAGDEDDPGVEWLAAAILHLLLVAPLDQRDLAGLRRALGDPDWLLASLRRPSRAADPHDPARAEIARVARNGDDAFAWQVFARAFAMLAPFAEGDMARLSRSISVRLADLMQADGPDLVHLAGAPGEAARIAPLAGAMLAEALCEFTTSRDFDRGGRRKARRARLALPDLAALPASSLLARRAAYAGACGLDLLLGARDLADLARHGLFWADFDRVIAVGAQAPDAARALADQAGAQPAWRWKRTSHSWSRLARGDAPLLDEKRLMHMRADEVVVAARGETPKRLKAPKHPRATKSTPTKDRFDIGPRPPLAHDWMQEPAPRMARAKALPAPRDMAAPTPEQASPPSQRAPDLFDDPATPLAATRLGHALRDALAKPRRKYRQGA